MVKRSIYKRIQQERLRRNKKDDQIGNYPRSYSKYPKDLSERLYMRSFRA